MRGRTRERGARRRAAPSSRGRADGRRPAAGPPHAGDRGRLSRWRGGRRLGGTGRGVRRAAPRLRPSQRRWRLAVLHPRGVRRGRGAVRARGAAGAADPGGAGDARRGRLQAAGQPWPGVRDPRCQRRRGDAHARRARSGGGGGSRRRDHRHVVPDHRILPRADRGHLARGPTGAGAVPARDRRRRRPRPDSRRAGADPARRACMNDVDDGLVRLQKLLAQSGVASRRRCEELMLAGLVEVDGEVVTRLGTKVDPAAAVIRVEGGRLPPLSPHVYLVLNKPRGVVSTMSDPEGRRSLGDLVADRPERLFHVGRLDTDTAGLIILTNDGDFAQRLAHPSYEVDKTYVAEVEGEIYRRTLKQLLEGVTLDDGPVTVSKARIIEAGKDKSIVEIVIHEGRNRIVRRLMDHLGYPVRRLTRTQIGPVVLRGLLSGEIRDLTLDELGALLDNAAL